MAARGGDEGAEDDDDDDDDEEVAEDVDTNGDVDGEEVAGYQALDQEDEPSSSIQPGGVTDS